MDSRDTLRGIIRRRALANLIIILMAEAQRTRGRFCVQPFGVDALRLDFFDVHTLVRQANAFRVEARDFSVVLGCPPLWPFDRESSLLPFIVHPSDFSHPNSNGREMCLDLRGVMPELLPGILYDNFRLRRVRLDHAVDPHAAAFVRSHLQSAADPRSLYPEVIDS
jgi:hypothetical protein